MAVTLSDLFPLRAARSSHASPAAHPLYRKHGRARAAVRPSKIGFETLEPRVLLSADVFDGSTLAAYLANPVIGNGVLTELDSGLNLLDEVADTAQGLTGYDDLLGTEIPGLLERETGGVPLLAKDFWAPTIADIVGKIGNDNVVLANRIVSFINGLTPVGGTPASFIAALDGQTETGADGLKITLDLLDVDSSTGGVQKFLLKPVGGANYEFLFHLSITVTAADTSDTFSLDLGRNADALELDYAAATPNAVLPSIALKTAFTVDTVLGVAATIVETTYDADPDPDPAAVNLQPRLTVTPTAAFVRNASFETGVTADVTTAAFNVLQFGFLDVKAGAGTAEFDMKVGALFTGTAYSAGDLAALTPTLTSDGEIEVLLPIEVDPALGGTGFGVASPVVRLYTDDPFSAIHAPIAGSDDGRTAIQIELQDFTALNPFRNIDAAGLANVFSGLGTMLDQLQSKAEMFGLKLPLVDATKISDALQFDGPMKTLYEALTQEVNGTRVARFVSVQDFITKLQTALTGILTTYNTNADFADIAALVGINPRYESIVGKPTLLFDIELHAAPTNDPIDVAGNLGLDLGALGDVAVLGELTLKTGFDLKLTLGIELVEAPDVGIVTVAAPSALIGRVVDGNFGGAAPAQFSVVLGTQGAVQISLAASNYGSPAALATALGNAVNAAIVAAVGNGGLPGPAPVVVVTANAQGRLVLSSATLPYLQIRMTANTSVAAFDELGFRDGQRASVSRLPVDGRLSSDASFSLTIGNNTFGITLAAATTAGNTTVAQLVAQLDAAIDAQFGAGTYATLIGDEVVGQQIKIASGQSFVRIDATNAVARAELGFIDDAVSSKLAILGDGSIRFDADPTADRLPASGNLGAPLTFTVQLKQGAADSGAIAVSATLSGNNIGANGVLLNATQAAIKAAEDINEAFKNTTLTGGQKLSAVLVATPIEFLDANGAGNNIWGIRFIQPAATLDTTLAYAFADSITIAGIGADDDIGLKNGSDDRVGPSLTSTLGGDATFTINLTGAGGAVTQQVISLDDNTITNTLQGVVDAINAAIGVGGKVVAGLDGSRLVFAVRDPAITVIELSSVNAIARDDLGLQEGISSRTFEGVQAFVRDVQLDASLEFDGTATGSANFGFVSLALGEATLALDASVEVDFGTGEAIYVKDIFNALGRPFAGTGGLVDVLEGSGGNGDLLAFGPGEDEEIDLAGSASLAWDGADISIFGIGDPDVIADLNGELGEVPAPYIHVTLADITDLDTLVVDASLGSLADLSNFGFDDAIAALRGIVQWLQAYVQSLDIVNEPLPLLGISLADTLGFVDDFAQAIEDIAANPTKSLQALLDKVNEGLQQFVGPAAKIGYQSNSPGILTFSIEFTRQFSDILPIEIDMVELLADEVGITVPGLELNGAANLAASFSVSAALVFGVDVGGLSAILDDPVHTADEVFDNIFLVVAEDDAENIDGYTHIELTGYASAENVTFTGALGPLGLFVTNGGAVLNSNGVLGNTSPGTIAIELPDVGTAGDGYITLAEFFDGANASAIFNAGNVAVNIGVAAVLPVSFPTSSNFIGNLDFTAAITDPFNAGGVTYTLNSIPDFSKIDFGSLSILETINLFLAGADTVLGTLGDMITEDVFGAGAMTDLPLVGDALKDAGAFIDQIRNEVIPAITNVIETAPELAADIFRQVGQILQDAIGALGWLDSAVTIELDNGGTISTFQFGGGQDFSGLAAAVLSADSFAYVIDLGVDFHIQPNDVNLNLEVFQLELIEPITVDISADLTFGIGVSLADGFFFQVNPDGEADLSGSIEINLPQDIRAQLFLIELNAHNNNFGVRPDLAAAFVVDLTGTGDDGRIGFGDITDLGFALEFGAEVDLDFELDLGVANIGGIGLPKILAEFDFAWGFGDVTVGATQFGVDADHPEKPLLALGNIRLDIGSFLGETIGPFISDIYEVIEPIDPILDILTNPIPVLSDLLGPTSLLDVAATFGLVNPGLVTALELLDQIVDFAATASNGNGFVTIYGGTLSFGGDGGLDLTDMDQVGGLADPTQAIGTVLSALEDTFDIDVPPELLEVIAFIGEGFDKGAIEGLSNYGGSTALGGFSFPFLENFEEVLGLFFGRNMTLVAYDLPPLEFGFDFSIYVPIWDGLGARFAGGINAVIDLAFGYDTEGIFRFINGGHNPLDLVQGFFVYDDNPFAGFTGIDVPEVLITGQITAAAELNLVVASAGVGGGIFATVGFDLADPDGDFRVRLDEIIANLVNGFEQGVGPLGLFDVDAKIEAKLFAYIEALFGLWRKEFQFGPSIPLYEKHYEVPHDPVLATDMENGVLRLNVGDFAGDRIYTNNGTDTPVDGDEELEIEIVSKTEIKVRGKGPDFDESAEWQTFTSKDPGGFHTILGYAGQGNDKIIVISDATAGLVKYQVEGGAGDDELQGGNAADEIFGGTGADHLRGGAGNDVIEGGAGADCLEGEAGNDTLYGGTGNDVLSGGADDDLLIGDAGDDVISGGLGADRGLGGDGIDLIAGGGGADVLMGNAGNDRLWGDLDFTFTDCVLDLAADGDEPLFAAPAAEGDDLLSGGGGADEIQGNGGNDKIWGDSTFKLDAAFALAFGADGLPLRLLPEFGNFGADNLSGGAGDDTIYGEAGNDLIRGDNLRVDNEDDDNPFTWAEGDRFSRGTAHGGTDGNDTIFAGRDSDIVYGNGGNDTIAGGTENDILFGNAGNDTITGDVGADVIFGDSGVVEIYLAGDTVVGGGAYAAATQDFKRLESSTEAGDGDDTIDAGQDNDIVFGGGGLGLQAPIGVLGQTIEDLIKAGSGDDIVFGDHGRVSFSYVPLAGAAFATDIVSVDKDFGGDDQLFGSTGRDVLVGGKGGDFVNGDDAYNPDDLDSRDVLAGDHVQMTQVVTLVAITPNIKVADVYVAAPQTIVSTEDDPTQGGDDTLDGGQDDDFLIGGPGDDLGTGGLGNDVLLGDRGRIDFDLSFIDATDADYVFDKGELFVLQTVQSTDLALADIPFTGIDRLSGGDGDDVVIGGGRGDFLFGDAPLQGAVGTLTTVSDILVGDNGRVEYQQHGLLARVTTTDTLDATGGNDTIEGNAGVDIAMGGVGSDDIWGGDNTVVTATDGDDILLGDNGRVDFTLDLTLALVAVGGTPNLATLDLIQSSTDGRGAADTIRGNGGADVAMGGTAGDTIYGDNDAASGGLLDGADMLLGDNGLMLLVNPALDPVLAGTDRRIVRGGAVALLRSTDENDAVDNTGGIDVISGNAAGDVIMGGVRGDTLYGDRAVPTATTNGRDGDDTLLGDNGALEWLSTGRLGDLPTAVATGDARWNDQLDNAFLNRDANLDTLDLVTTEQPNNGGRDLVYGGNGRDIVFGGTDADTIHGDTGSETDGLQSTLGNDLLFGDHGRLYVQLGAVVPNMYSRNFFAIHTGQGDGGEGDRIWGEEGMDILLGQQGDDRLWGGSGDDDLTGGHNVIGGADELNLTTIAITTAPTAWNDVMDGGSGDDTMAGDNSIVWRTGDSASPRFRTLTGATLYTTTESTVSVNVTSTDQRDPDGTTGRFVFLLDHADGTATGLFGNDVMAGGAGRDTMFGQLGDDLMQGDGLIDTTMPGAIIVSRTLAIADSVAPSTGGTLYFRVPEQATDGDDYLEGNGGSDTMYGGLGQDDMIGGSSSLYGLDPALKQGSTLRPDSTDWMWGGAGVQVARGDQGYLLRADLGGTDPAGLAAETPVAAERGRDADHMLGDNGNIFRIVKTGVAPGTTEYVRFQYDNAGYSGASNPLVVRAMEWLDYTLGGADFDQNLLLAGIQTTQLGDNGAGDYMHGEAGNDTIHGMAGSDILFGDAHDDDITGGYGHDWITGGTGRDGVIGDDGIIRTSRNSTTGETLFGVTGLLATDPSSKDSNGNVLNEVITTPGSIQRAVINVTGELTKAMDLTPLSVDATWMAVDDEFGYANQSAAGAAPYADDVIYGGLGSDWLHGGSGDDAISGAEALAAFYTAAHNGTPGTTTTNTSSVNAGNQLRFNPVDLISNHTRERAGEFALYDEYNPLRQIRVSTSDGWSGDLLASGGNDFILNFDENEGVVRASENVPTNGNNVIVTGAVRDDGDDRIFGDGGNDWLVGGTGRDNVYGGWGNDLMNVDDDQTTGTGILNDTPDTHSTYEDRAYGGAGRDVLIANTGGDRLIDWVGEWNSYLVPFAPFGMATVSRTLQPQLPEFLYALSRADGADPTIVADGNGTAIRNGEPYGELGLVLQKDAAWQDQTGAPADPQAGNIPGGKRDVLRSADFNNQQGQGFVAESGSWSISNGKYDVAPSASSSNKDAISLYFTGEPVPTYFEVAATINAIKPTGGFKANAYIIFDYVSPDNFKFAGLNVSTNKIEIGQRASWGFQVLKSMNATLKAGQDYNVLLAVNGNAVTFVVNGSTSISHAFTPRVDDQGIAHPIRDGMVGLGGDNARARIDDVRLQILPPTITYAATDGFDPTPNLLSAQAGNWSAQGGRFVGTPVAGSVAAITSNEIAVGVSAYLQLDSSFKLVGSGATAGIVFDKYSATDFKWVGISAGKLMIGHYTAKAGWVVDMTVLRADVIVGSDVALSIALKGSTVSVTLNGATVASRVYNATLVDGAVGTFARGGAASFDSFGLKTDDAKMSTAQSSSVTTTPSTTTTTTTSAATAAAAPTLLAATTTAAPATLSKTSTASIELTDTARTDSTGEAEAASAPAEETTARASTSDADGAVDSATALPTIDWSQLIVVVADDGAATRYHDDAANADRSALWQEDFVGNLGQAARNPNAALRFTI